MSNLSQSVRGAAAATLALLITLGHAVSASASPTASEYSITSCTVSASGDRLRQGESIRWSYYPQGTPSPTSGYVYTWLEEGAELDGVVQPGTGYIGWNYWDPEPMSWDLDYQPSSFWRSLAGETYLYEDYQLSAPNNSGVKVGTTPLCSASFYVDQYKAFSTFGFATAGETTTINESTRTVSVTVRSGTDRSRLASTFTVTDDTVGVTVGSVAQVSGTTSNTFNDVVTYTLTAEDGSIITWTVIVTIAGMADANLGPMAVGVPYSDGVLALDANATYAVTSGNLPRGLVLNSATGAITGTPTASGAYSFQITITNSDNSTIVLTFNGSVEGSGGESPEDEGPDGAALAETGSHLDATPALLSVLLTLAGVGLLRHNVGIRRRLLTD